MGVYSKPFTGITLNTTNSIWNAVPSATAAHRILEHYVGGEATTSTVLRLAVARQNAAGTGTTPTVYTPLKLNPASGASLLTTLYGGLSALVAWGTAQETLLDPVFVQTFNAFGGTDRWVPQPGEELYIGVGAAANAVSARALSGTPVVSGHLIFEDL